MTPDNPQERMRDLIEERLLGINPDDQDVVLEDDDWRLIIAALDAASRSIPAGEDAGLIAEIRDIAPDVRRGRYWPADEYTEEVAALLDRASARLSSLSSELEQVRARPQIGWAYRDRKWDNDRWHLCQEEPRAFDGREVRPVYLGAALPLKEPERQGGANG